MTLVSTGDVVGSARAAGDGVGAFNVIQLEQATAVVAGAEAAGRPVILQISENAVRYHGSLAPLGKACVAIAKAASVPVAVHLDHATDVDLVWQAIDLGFGSAMYDGSTMDYEANVAVTAEVTARCHRHEMWVEAELGEVGGKDGVHAPGARTDPDEAVAFVAATGVDALAVAVGTSHAMLTTDAALDLELISRLRAALEVPLVLHGSSGVPDDDLMRAVAAGLTKINIGTRLNKAYTRAVRELLATDDRVVDPRRYIAPAREAVAGEVARVLALLHLKTSA